jgi:hypothetical protein
VIFDTHHVGELRLADASCCASIRVPCTGKRQAQKHSPVARSAAHTDGSCPRTESQSWVNASITFERNGNCWIPSRD